eukprot:1156611-Pelagomonas_calceolata.AAC.4
MAFKPCARIPSERYAHCTRLDRIPSKNTITPTAIITGPPYTMCLCVLDICRSDSEGDWSPVVLELRDARPPAAEAGGP